MCVLGMDCAVGYYERDGVRVVPVTGEFDFSNIDWLEALIEVALNGAKPVVLDFQGTNYIDSTVLSVLVRQKQRAGDRLRIVVPAASKLRRIFELSDLEKQLQLQER
jgi:anti-anti-sigma factor